MTLVLESPGNLLERSWNLLGSGVRGSFWFQTDMFMQTKNSHNCCHQVCRLSCRYAKNAFTARVPLRTPLAELTALSQILLLLFVAIFKHCWLTIGSWKNASGGLESPRKVWNFL